MTLRKSMLRWVIALLAMGGSQRACGEDLIPPLAKIKTDRPRVLLRAGATPHAISLDRLRAGPRHAEFRQMLAQLRSHPSAAAQAMVWLLSGDRTAADRALERMRAYTYPGSVDTFHVYFRLCELALAYDWLYDYEGFTAEIKAQIRGRVMPLAQRGLRQTDDHVFHNYIWMSAGGTALWALATAGEDDPADRLFEQIADRLNRRLFPAMRYLDGLPCEPMGYWALYDLTPGALAILGAQSAFEENLVAQIRHRQNDWLGRHFHNLIHSTLPDLRYAPWGDLQGGPNGGVTREMAGAIDAMTWALRSPQGSYFSRRLARKCGLRRFYGDTAVFYMLYTRNLDVPEALPPLSFMAGNTHSGHFIARSGWQDGDTVVTFRCTDHFGDHNHYDQGSFVIYRNGLLAVDPPVYRRIRGPQQITGHHNTLLLDGRPQRPARGQWFTSVEQFRENLLRGRKLETGEMPFFKEAGAWAAVAGRFDQAYPTELVHSCVRQLLFVRPEKVVVVDQLAAAAGGDLPEVQWLLQVPKPPVIDAAGLWVSNGKSWLRCRSVWPRAVVPTVTQTPVGTHCASFSYPADGTLTLVHLLEVGDGDHPGQPDAIQIVQTAESIRVTLDGNTFIFAKRPPFAVSM